MIYPILTLLSHRFKSTFYPMKSLLQKANINECRFIDISPSLFIELMHL